MAPQDENYWINRPINDLNSDWKGPGGWIEGYWESWQHPHRQLIINAIRLLWPVAGILEIGCASGPNLRRLKEEFPETQLAGVDVNENAIRWARERMAGPILKVSKATELPFEDKSFDIVLADAVLIYVPPKDIKKVISEMDRVARKAIILCEWDAKAKLGKIVDDHWARDYKALLEDGGFLVEKYKLTSQDWPAEKWERNGYLYIALVQ